MFKALGSLFGSKKGKIPQKKKRDPKRYATEKERASSNDVKVRLKLAKDPKAHPEILYFLSEDPDPKVRKAVASNQATPLQASEVLVKDSDDDVRLALAKRLVDLLPDLSEEKHSQLYAFAVQSLASLALDEVLKIRVALSTALKDYAKAPPKVVTELAKDIERQVSEPILRFCTAVPDDVLLDILEQHPANWAVAAIAGRPSVSEAVSQGVFETEDVPANAILLDNDGANIAVKTLAKMVAKAKEFPEWQKPLAARKNLPPDMAKELADYADASVRDILLNRTDFDAEMTEEIAAIVKRRLDFANEHERSEEPPEQRVAKLVKEGNLTDETISDGLSWRDWEFVKHALAHMARTDYETVDRMVNLGTAKPIVSLAWKAELPMQVALQLQKDMAKIPPKEVLYPKNGTDYPLSRDDIVWQLDFFGIAA